MYYSFTNAPTSLLSDHIRLQRSIHAKHATTSRRIQERSPNCSTLSLLGMRVSITNTITKAVQRSLYQQQACSTLPWLASDWHICRRSRTSNATTRRAYRVSTPGVDHNVSTMQRVLKHSNFTAKTMEIRSAARFNLPHDIYKHFSFNATRLGWDNQDAWKVARFFRFFLDAVLDPVTLRFRRLDTKFLAKLTSEHDVCAQKLGMMEPLMQFLMQSTSAFRRNVGLELTSHLARLGRPKAILLISSYIFRKCRTHGKSVLRTDFAQEQRRLLRVLIETDYEFAWVARIIEAGFLEVGDNIGAALSQLERALMPAMEYRKTEHEENIRDWLMDETVSPWTDAYRLAIKADQENVITKDKVEILVTRSLRCGIAVGDAMSFYHAAMNISRKQNLKAGDLRPSDWLYYMTKAASLGVPEAATELGSFYWNTPPPYISETQLPSNDLVFRLKRGLGIPGMKTSPEDILSVAGLPNTMKGRALLARQWYDTAISARYAPALCGMLEIYTSDKYAQYPSSPSEGGSAKTYIIALGDALDAQELWKFAEKKESSKAESRDRVIEVHLAEYDEDTAQRMMEVVNIRSISEDVATWFKYAAVFDTWAHDPKLCQDMKEKYELHRQAQGVARKPKLQLDLQ